MTGTTSDEPHQLSHFLDEARAEMTATLAGLNEEQARRRLVPSLTTPIGLITHLTYVEQIWFQVVLEGRTRAELGLPREIDPTFIAPDGATVASVLAGYERACEASRQTAARYPLDHVAEHPRIGSVSVRWIHLHLLREINRHAGHADILREQILASPHLGDGRHR